MWHVYILQSSSGLLYVGLTSDLKRRQKEHQYGKSHYSSYNPNPFLIYSEHFKSKAEAARREKQIKGWTRAKKLALAQGNFELLKKL